MVRYQRFHQLRKGEQIEEKEDPFSSFVVLSGKCIKRSNPKLFSLLSLVFLSFLSCCYVFAPHPFHSSPSAFSVLGSIYCDRRGFRSDICFMKGDIRTRSLSSSAFLYTSQDNTDCLVAQVPSITEQEQEPLHEKIKPYTRKWETSIMNTIQEIHLIGKNQKQGIARTCDVHHDVPAVFFSTGGYTGNVYHEFNDGILPLYITSQHFRRKVVFVILDYHKWWEMKYKDVLSQLSDYPLIDFSGDRRTHCFLEAIVGLRIHDDLTLDPSQMKDSKTIIDFRNLLDRAYRPRIESLIKEEEPRPKNEMQKPKLVIFSRKGSRAITNEDSLVKMAKRTGFSVVVLRPDRTTELAKIYRVLNSSDVMVGVHGAAMTHFLFMRPGSVFIQIIPLGTDWAAETYYGEPQQVSMLRAKASFCCFS